MGKANPKSTGRPSGRATALYFRHHRGGQVPPRPAFRRQPQLPRRLRPQLHQPLADLLAEARGPSPCFRLPALLRLRTYSALLPHNMTHLAQHTKSFKKQH